jgi:FkbM family methyltransferase
LKNQIIRIRRLLRSKYDGLYSKNWQEIQRFGDQSAWFIYTAYLDHKSIIYSAGVGRDISFEKQLIDIYNCNIYLYDPSPTGLSTMATPENMVPGLFFKPVGLSDKDGLVKFSQPLNKEEGSYTVVGENDLTEFFECRRLSTLMIDNGHHYIDLLKMDIEGFEYSVIRDIIQHAIPIHQLCVEFHDFLNSVQKSYTKRTLQELKRADYQLIFRDRCNYTFLNQKFPGLGQTY